MSDMGKYIEREALLNALKQERKNGNFVFTSKWIKEIMDDLPTADVVPKSEVEKLKADVEVWKQNRFNIYQKLECYKMTRAKVAREIFGEIEKAQKEIVDRMQEFINECKQYSESTVDYFGGKYEAMEVDLRLVKSILTDKNAELKKKYTEGEG